MNLRVALVTLGLVAGARETGAQDIDTVWTIRGGTFDGVSVRIDPSRAASKTSRYWRLSSPRSERRIIGWNPSRLPAAVAFRAGAGMGASDSAAFWSILRQLESDIGMHLFEPVSLEQGDDPYDVIVVDTKPMPSHEGVTFITWTNVGSLYDARVFFRSKEAFRDQRIVTHEMMHALGFGHTTAWKSVMNPALAFTPRLTAEDVAYAQVALASRAATERSEMWSRLALAVSREPSMEQPLPSCEPFQIEQDPDCRLFR